MRHAGAAPASPRWKRGVFGGWTNDARSEKRRSGPTCTANSRGVPAVFETARARWSRSASDEKGRSGPVRADNLRRMKPLLYELSYGAEAACQHGGPPKSGKTSPPGSSADFCLLPYQVGWPEGDAPSSPGSQPGTLTFMLRPQGLPISGKWSGVPGSHRATSVLQTVAFASSLTPLLKTHRRLSTAGFAPAASAFAGRRSDLLSYVDVKTKAGSPTWTRTMTIRLTGGRAALTPPGNRPKKKAAGVGIATNLSEASARR